MLIEKVNSWFLILALFTQSTVDNLFKSSMFLKHFQIMWTRPISFPVANVCSSLSQLRKWHHFYLMAEISKVGITTFNYIFFPQMNPLGKYSIFYHKPRHFYCFIVNPTSLSSRNSVLFSGIHNENVGYHSPVGFHYSSNHCWQNSGKQSIPKSKLN